MDAVMIKGSCKPLPKRTTLTNYLPWFWVPVNKVTHVFISKSKSIHIFLKVNYLALWGKQYSLRLGQELRVKPSKILPSFCQDAYSPVPLDIRLKYLIQSHFLIV